ncbi:hypothetical protein [Moraxella catarrhalis]|nr:hypothetical protein [Moraxella catarrhalis]
MYQIEYYDNFANDFEVILQDIAERYTAEYAYQVADEFDEVIK